MKWCVLAVVLGVQSVWAQAPIERRPPPPPTGAQAPKDADNVQDVSDGKSPQGGFPTIKVETRLVNVAVNVVDAIRSQSRGTPAEAGQLSTAISRLSAHKPCCDCRTGRAR